MSRNGLDVNTAALSVVSIARGLMATAQNREKGTPGFVALSGPTGFGKSTACAYLANKHGAYYVECKSVWSKKALLENTIYAIFGRAYAKATTVSGMLDQISEQLAKSGRPLIIDEFDYLVEKAAVQIVRDIYESSKAAIMLVGEENMPAKLLKWERFHGRVLDWAVAPAADMDDVRTLSGFYSSGITIQDDLLEHIHSKAKGSVRRITINLVRVRQEAIYQGLSAISLKEWGKKELFTGEAPQPRRQL